MTTAADQRIDKTASDIQDMVILKARALGVFKNLFTTPMEVFQPGDLPAIAVFLSDEVLDSLGNAGEPSFQHAFTIGVQAIVVSSDAEDQRAKIVAVLGQLDNALFRDTVMLLYVEEVKRVVRRFKYERVAETPIVHLNMAVTMTFKSDWQSVVLDDFRSVGIGTTFPVGGDVDSTIQVHATWEIPT